MHSGGAPTPPDSKRIVRRAFYEVEMFPPAPNESDFNSLLGCKAKRMRHR